MVGSSGFPTPDFDPTSSNGTGCGFIISTRAPDESPPKSLSAAP